MKDSKPSVIGQHPKQRSELVDLGMIDEFALNFVVADPPMKFIVVEDEGEPGSINHLGIEHETGEGVAVETRRLSNAGLEVELDDPHTCCYATQEKGWARDADGLPWEIYTVVADTANFGASPRA